MSDADRVRAAVEGEFGPLSDIGYLDLLGTAVKTIMTKVVKEREAAGDVIERRPTGLSLTDEALTDFVRRYPKTIKTILRELSIYDIVSRRDGMKAPPPMQTGIAVAIIDHILQEGEMH